MTAGNPAQAPGIQRAKVPPFAATCRRSTYGDVKRMDRTSSTRAALATLALAVLLPVSPASAGTPVAAKAPSFTLPSRAGTVSLDSLRAKVVLVDFWASWCGPCKSSFPWMNAMQQRYGPKGLSIVAINVDKSRGAAEAFLEKHPPSFTVAFDPDGKAAKAYKVWGMPTSYLIGPDRKVLFARSGFDPRHAKDVEAMIQEACSR